MSSSGLQQPRQDRLSSRGQRQHPQQQQQPHLMQQPEPQEQQERRRPSRWRFFCLGRRKAAAASATTTAPIASNSAVQAAARPALLQAGRGGSGSSEGGVQRQSQAADAQSATRQSLRVAPNGRARGSAAGAGLRRASRSTAAGTAVPLPSLAEQRSIWPTLDGSLMHRRS
ncbi:hypothetical protein BOX15_Mlig025079g3 [Macrostomum lignano]|uniref:Uncharacterized protein n=1 Tax=Macrostomum lignano TaxID=282301 RepID=A0A267FX23_9PLAT|nr:hypothetical protein BOX15_Mlig025079g3 [Macrostomum lignano]